MMTLGASSYASLADVKWGELRSERMMAELTMVDGWVRFRPLYRGRCLRNLIMCYVGHSSRST